MKRYNHFDRLCSDHLESLPEGSSGKLHMAAWSGPNRKERPIRDMILAYAAMADSYRGAGWEPGDRELGQDGYFHEHATSLIEAMRAYLNFDVGRFDCGTLDRLICKLAADSGVELDP
jgi:hypothetical protein